MLTSTTDIKFYDLLDTIQGGINGTYKWLRDMGMSPEDCRLAITQATTNAMVTEYCQEIIEESRRIANADKKQAN